MFEEHFAPLVHALLDSLELAPGPSHISIFEAIASLIASQEDLETVKPLMPIVLNTLQQNFNHGLILAFSITHKLKDQLATHADEFMSLYLPQLQTNPSEQLLMAIGYLLQGTILLFALLTHH